MIVSVLAIMVLSVGPVSAQTNTVSGAVRYVTDGDTFKLRGVERPIRVWGLDAPERNERGASAATSTLRRLVAAQTRGGSVHQFGEEQSWGKQRSNYPPHASALNS
jgi:micrococcal nuclease